MKLDILEEFISFLTYEKGLSTTTTKLITYHVSKFKKYLQINNINISTYSKKDVCSFISIKSIQTRISQIYSISTFNKFLIMNKIRQDYIPLARPKTPQRLPQQLPNQQKLLAIIYQLPENNMISLRNKAIIAILYATGMRAKELCELRIYQLNITQKFVLIHGKGNRERIVPIADYALTIIKKYLIILNSLKVLKPNDLLFINKFYKPLSNLILNNIIKSSTNNVVKHCHVLRHCFATHLMNNNANVSVIQKLLGHSSITTTTIYLSISSEYRKKAYLHHPRH